MHPEIAKFWKRQYKLVSWAGVGYEIVSKVPYDTDDYVGIPIVENMVFFSSAVNPYHFDGRWYSEREMFAIIKMKAFV